MATNRSGHRPGGGLHSRVVKHSSNPKVEPRPHARNPGAAGQYGQMQGSHVTRGEESSYRGEPDPTMRRGYNAPVGPTNMALSGPGAGREVMRSGSQSTWGNAAPGNAPSKTRDILSQFGPDYRRPGNPRSDTDADF
jgi:hypothetical protein